jgi:uncharacterized protein
MEFISPSLGSIRVEDLFHNITTYIEESPSASYKFIIGTDSQTTQHHTIFITAIIIQRVGKGAKFYYSKLKKKPILDLRSRIYTETDLSLQITNTLKMHGLSKIITNWPMEIHIDIGRNGDTRKLIHEVVGWVTSVGYDVKIKPDSFGASSVADKFTS